MPLQNPLLMKEKIKDLRLQIDALAQIVGTMRGAHLVRTLITDGNNIKGCHGSLLFAKAWLGKTLGALGQETPYKNDGHRKTVADIEPTSDRNNHVFHDDLEKVEFETSTYIEKIDLLRQKIQIVCDRIYNIIDGSDGNYRPIGNLALNLSLQSSFNHICEARFHLGFELEMIREKSNLSHALDSHG